MTDPVGSNSYRTWPIIVYSDYDDGARRELIRVVERWDPGRGQWSRDGIPPLTGKDAARKTPPHIYRRFLNSGPMEE